MIVKENDLKKRYASMSNEELADIARSADLTDVAKKCLQSEIHERGLENLETQTIALEKADKHLEKHRQKKIHDGKNSIKTLYKPFFIIGAVFFIIGLALYLFSIITGALVGSLHITSSKEEKLGLFVMATGGFLILLGIVKSAARLALLKLVYRK